MSPPETTFFIINALHYYEDANSKFIKQHRFLFYIHLTGSQTACLRNNQKATPRTSHRTSPTHHPKSKYIKHEFTSKKNRKWQLTRTNQGRPRTPQDLPDSLRRPRTPQRQPKHAPDTPRQPSATPKQRLGTTRGPSRDTQELPRDLPRNTTPLRDQLRTPHTLPSASHPTPSTRHRSPNNPSSGL